MPAKDLLRVPLLLAVIQAAPPPHEALLLPFLGILNIFMLQIHASLIFPGLSLKFRSPHVFRFLELV